jgi:general secretion pathway protein B
MSFILDALKKSENDRQRQTGPALFEVRVAAPRSKFPLLAVSIVSLLVVNLAVVAWLMLRRPASAAVPPATAATPQTQAGAAAPVAQPQAPPNVPATVQPPPNSLPPAYGAQAPQQNAYPQPPAQTGYAASPSAGGYPVGGQSTFPTGPEPMLAAEPQQPLNPDDYEPARSAPPPGTGAGHVTRTTESGLPNYEEAALKTEIPVLHMDLHSYSPDPAKRFVLINMKRLYEGQAMPDGVKLEKITNDAVILSYNGTRFVLDRD